MTDLAQVIQKVHIHVKNQSIPDNYLEAEMLLEQSKISQKEAKCSYAAPYICFQKQDRGWYLMQGCCNHWDCPRCGQLRAREEYGRIVEGAKSIEQMGHKMYFWTLTCRGKDMPLHEAEEGYLRWTDKLLTATRNRAKRADNFWCYIAVTERQKRGHPHSHLINTYCPEDAIPYSKGERLPNGRNARRDCLWSDWFRQANVSAGLGTECDLSAIRSAGAVAVYVSKYLFKETVNEIWPKGWKRVRYSQNWPKLPELTNPTAFPVIRFYDWMRVLDLGEAVRADSVATYIKARQLGVVNVKSPQGWL